MLGRIGRVGAAAAGVVAIGVGTIHFTHRPASDIRKLQEERLGTKNPTPIVFPSELHVKWPVFAVNELGDWVQNRGIRLFRPASKENLRLLDELAAYLPDRELANMREGLRLADEESDPVRGDAPISSFLYSFVIKEALTARLQVEQEYAKYKEELDHTELAPRIIITGQPRTGSTFLHFLLAQDPNARHLSAWEQSKPLPMPTSETYYTDPRIGEMEEMYMKMEMFVENIVERMRRCHDNDKGKLEEEILLHLHCLLFLLFDPRKSKFMDWLTKPNPEAYQYIRRFLVLSQKFHPPRKHWVLKTPLHGIYFDNLLEEFGRDDKTVVVVTHRDPVNVVPSFAQLAAVNSILVCRDAMSGKDCTFVKEDFGKFVVKFCHDIVTRIEEGRQKYQGPAKIIDVEFSDIVKDPLGTVRRIYAEAGMDFSPEAEDAVKAYITRNAEERKRKRQGGNFNPTNNDDYGVDVDYIKTLFADYREAHGYAK
mmetsp:Transcript_4126/g.11525  ORF Transcript_4126/g.11525 Transcript_4126/m.11525 type:complete len:482 (-) Transcript_4126:321-1766(-)